MSLKTLFYTTAIIAALLGTWKLSWTGRHLEQAIVFLVLWAALYALISPYRRRE